MRSAAGPQLPGDAQPARLDGRGILAVAHAVAEQVGLDSTSARIIKFTNNAVVRLPHAKAVVRIAGSSAVRHRLDAVMLAARLFHERGIPAVRLHPRGLRPIEALGQVATVWVDAEMAGAPQAAPADLARILQAIHAMDDAPASLPSWDPIGNIRRRIMASDGAGESDLAFLDHECHTLEKALKESRACPPLLPPGLIHGDAILGNLIASRPGPVICDFDSTSIGPREWDLTPTAVGTLRMNLPGNQQKRLADAYGHDVTNWEGFSTFRRLRELQLVTSALPTLRVNPAVRPQWQHRLDTLKARDDRTLWDPYPHT